MLGLHRKSQLKDIVINNIDNIFCDYLCEDASDILADDISIKPLRKSRNSHTYELGSSKFNQSFFVKRVVNGSTSAEYQSLTTLNKKFSHKKYKVPVAVACFESENIIFQEFIIGQNLQTLLADTNRIDEQKLRFVEECAEWIFSYHSIDTVESKPIDIVDRYRILEQESIILKKDLMSDEYLGPAISWLKNTAKEYSSIPVSQGYIHGDCKPENFIVTDAGICGFDFIVCENGIQIYDIAQFLNHLTFLSFKNRTNQARMLIDSMIQIFISKYGNQTLSDDEKEVLKWVRLAHYIRYMSMENKLSIPFVKDSKQYFREEIKYLM